MSGTVVAEVSEREIGVLGPIVNNGVLDAAPVDVINHMLRTIGRSRI